MGYQQGPPRSSGGSFGSGFSGCLGVGCALVVVAVVILVIMVACASVMVTA
jgi:hypothetical protein